MAAYYIQGIPVRVLNRMIEDLRMNGLWAERHSYSVRIMHRGRFVASLHIYPGFSEATLRLTSGDPGVDAMVRNTVERMLGRYLPGYRMNVVSVSLSMGDRRV